MAKTGLMGGGGGQTPPIFANKSPVFTNPGSVFRRGEGGILPERGSRAQFDMVQALLQSGLSGAQQSGSPLLAFLAPMVGGAVGARTGGLYKDAQTKRDQSATDTLLAAMGGGGNVAAPTVASQGGAQAGQGSASLIDQMYPIGQTGPVPTDNVDPKTGLNMGDPVDFAAYEARENLPSGYLRRTAQIESNMGRNMKNPNSSATGPFQFIDSTARQYGLTNRMDWSQSTDAAARLAADNSAALTRVLGRQPTGGELYLAHQQGAGGAAKLLANPNARAVDIVGADAVSLNGGNPDMTAQQFADLWISKFGGTPARNAAARLATGDFSTMAGAGQTQRMGQDDMRALIGLMTNQDVSPEIRELASTMLGNGMQGGQPLSPQDQIGLATSMLGLEQALQPPKPEDRFRPATPEEAAQYGAQAGQIGPDGRFYPSNTGNDSNGTAAIQRQRNEATTIIGKALSDLQTQGNSREEALAIIARDPIYRQQFEILGVDPAQLAREQVLERNEETQENVGFWQRLFGGGSSPAPASATPAPAPQNDSDPLGLR